MKFLKKSLLLLLCLMQLVSFSACAKKQEEDVTPPKEETSYADRDVSYPSEIPAFEEDAIYIHYQRTDNKYEPWALWLWDPDGTDDNVEDQFAYQDDYGVVAAFPLSHFGNANLSRLGIIVKSKGSWSAKDGSESDRFIVFSTLKKDENNIYHVYLVQEDPHIYATADKVITDDINSLLLTGEKSLFIDCSNAVESFKIYQNGNLIEEASGAGRSKFTHTLKEPADFSSKYEVEVLFRASGTTIKKEVSPAGLYNSDSFNELYYYDGDLGALYSAKETTFRVWSPASSKIVLRIYDNGTPTSVSKEKGSDACEEVEMTKGEKGTYETTVSGNLEGKYYTYVAFNNKYPDGMEIVDPYAKAAGVNGLRGMIVDFSKTNPAGWDKVEPNDEDRKELTVYEMHVADLTSSKTWGGSEANAKKYLGLIEQGTLYEENGTSVSTGFDHIKELGVNAVQLLPIFDQANDETKEVFNWGYNPLNYNVLEGQYSSDPYDGYTRIKEFKEVVKAYSNADIGIIMDVVYNHVNGAERSNFDVLMPGYYFRYKNDGSLSNGSGCGNEVASENRMVRKFIIDSVCFWLKEYKLSGFRFDLMGLHDIETMNAVVKAAKEINPDVVIYGEPWTGGTTTLDASVQAIQKNANKFEGYGQFNDQMRDALIRGGLHSPTELGWVNGTKIGGEDLLAIKNGINGITYNLAYTIEDEDRTVNYVTCHDNFTLYDRMKAAGVTDEETIKKMCVLANSVVFTSKGTTFMLSGEEFLRSKQGNSNSYNASYEVNELDYSLKIKNLDVFDNYRKLTEFKQEADQLESKDPITVEEMQSGAVLIYDVNDDEESYKVIHANNLAQETTIEAEGYEIYLDTLNYYENSVNKFTLHPYQTLILRKR